MTDNDYRVTIKVRNNNILTYMEQLGIKTAAELSRLCGVTQVELGRLINMKDLPVTHDGYYRASTLRLCDLFCCAPEDLFNEQQMSEVIKTNTADFVMSKEDVGMLLCVTGQKEYLLEDELHREEMIPIIRQCLSSLTEREAQIIKMRFGLTQDGQDYTLEEVSRQFGVNRERIRQIESKALRKLRQRSKSRTLIENLQ